MFRLWIVQLVSDVLASGAGGRLPNALCGRSWLNCLCQRSMSVEEKNGFTLIDLSQDEVTVRPFRWRRGEPEPAIDTLKPYHTFISKRG